MRKIGPAIVLVLFGLGGCASVGQNSGQPSLPSPQAESFGDYLSARLAASDHNTADAAKLYPDLWPTSQAARKAYSRDGLDVKRNRRRSVTASDKDDDAAAGPRSMTGPYKYRFIRERVIQRERALIIVSLLLALSIMKYPTFEAIP